ncbi:MAG TPA: hypothetical protein VJT74_01185 [Pyrinomonadaceae bacterium]|nr:hypothetical protein [Pyrinomonadaceae bacterium]
MITVKRVPAVLLLCALTLVCAATVPGQSKPQLVSVRSNGSGSGNGVSGDFGRYRISADGRYVVFYSEASNLVPEDRSADGDIFVRDLLTGKTTLVSVEVAGLPSSSGLNALISADGRYVAYISGGVFLRDLQAGTTRRVNVNMSGTEGRVLAESILTDMSPDGRFITFYSGLKDLTPHADGNDTGTDIYIRDMQSDRVELVSVNTAGTATGNGMSFGGSVSGDGRYVVFTSEASDLVANDTPTRDIFLRDRQTGTTTRLSTNRTGTGGGNANSGIGVIDRGGRVVVFGTEASDLSPLTDVNGLSDIFIYDVRTKTKKLVTINAAGSAAGNGFSSSLYFNHGVEFSISDDARYVAFMSQSGDLVTNDANGNGDDVFLYEVATQKKTLVSVNPSGNSSSISGSFNPSISAGGRFVAFDSLANDLVSVADEQNGYTTDVFVRDMVAGKTYLASINSAGTRTGNGFSFQPVISADGSRLVFFSRAGNLVTGDVNGYKEDVFAFSLPVEGTPILLTEANTDRAVALDSVTHLRDPFPLLTTQNFSADKRTRVSLMAWRLELQPGEDISAISALAEDEQGVVHDLTVEYVGAVPGLDAIKQLVVILPSDVNGSKTLWLKLSLRGMTSNRALLRIK